MRHPFPFVCHPHPWWTRPSCTYTFLQLEIHLSPISPSFLLPSVVKFVVKSIGRSCFPAIFPTRRIFAADLRAMSVTIDAELFGRRLEKLYQDWKVRTGENGDGRRGDAAELERARLPRRQGSTCEASATRRKRTLTQKSTRNRPKKKDGIEQERSWWARDRRATNCAT